MGRVGLRGGGDADGVVGSGLLAALSSGARCMTASFIPCAWGCHFFLAGVDLFGFLLVGFVFWIVFHEGLVAREVRTLLQGVLVC